MALSKFEKDMGIISALLDVPYDEAGMTAEKLKAKFDEGGEAIKQYINETLTSEIDANKADKSELQGLVLGQIPDGTVTAEKLNDKTMIHFKDGTLETLDGKSAVPRPQVGEIMLVATPVEDLPDNVLPCTGGFYDKSAFPELYGAIGAYAGVKFPAHSSTVSNVYISYLKDGLVGYDRVRCETYVQAEVQSKTVYVLNENMELVRTITLPLADHSSYQALSVYDGAVAYNHDGTSPDPDTFCVSLDGGITFYTYAMPSAFSNGVGMSKTKLYNFHDISPCSMVIFDKLTKTFSTKSLTSLPLASKFSFTNDDYCFLLHESNNDGIYTQTAQYVQDKINSSDIDGPIRIYPATKGSIFSYFTSYKGLLIGVYATVNKGVSTATAGDVFWYDPARNKSGTFITMHPEKMYLNITSTNFWSENSEALYMLSYYAGNYCGVRITVNQKTGVGASASASVDATDSSLSSCKLAVATENHVLRASYGSTDYQNLCEISSLNAQFCVPDISNIQGTTAYIYTGEE